MRWALLWIVLMTAVLIPFFLFEDQFNALAERIARGDASSSLAALAIGGLLALDVFLPVPSSIVSTAAGVLLGLWPGASVVWVGMMAGCGVGYFVGVKSAPLARRLVGPGGLARAAVLADRYGVWAVVVCRPIPVLAEATVVFAGLVRAPLGRFLRLTALSNLGIAAGYAAIGAFSMQLDSFLLAFIGAIAVPGLALLVAKGTGFGLWKTPPP
jgi:membrane protein DedA with SNARE-associated domain